MLKCCQKSETLIKLAIYQLANSFYRFTQNGKQATAKMTTDGKTTTKKRRRTLEIVKAEKS